MSESEEKTKWGFWRWFGTILAGLVIIGLGYYIVRREVKYKLIQSQLEQQLGKLEKVVSTKDSLIFSYSAMIDNYSNTERQLRKEVRQWGEDYARLADSKDHRILSLAKYNATLQNQIDTLGVRLSTIDSILTVEIEDYYPDKKDYFVKYYGLVQLGSDNPVIAREFSFNPILIKATVVEKPDGSWYQTVSAPSWVNFDKIQVQSLPPDKYVPSKPKIKFLAGAGSAMVFGDVGQLVVTGGIKYDKWYMLGNASYRYLSLTVLREFNR